MSGNQQGRTGGKKSSGVAGKESFQRINYLFQMAALSSSKNPVLSSYYGRLCRHVGQKAVLRMEPEMKRKICKRCKIILIPGSTAQLVITGRDRACEIQCNNCNTKKTFHVNPDYKMWLDNPESIVETISMEQQSSANRDSAAPTAKEAKPVSNG